MCLIGHAYLEHMFISHNLGAYALHIFDINWYLPAYLPYSRETKGPKVKSFIVLHLPYQTYSI